MPKYETTGHIDTKYLYLYYYIILENKVYLEEYMVSESTFYEWNDRYDKILQDDNTIFSIYSGDMSKAFVDIMEKVELWKKTKNLD